MTTDHPHTCAIDAEPLAQRYENMRAQVLSGIYQLDRAWGLGTLLGLGLRAWINRAQPDFSGTSDNLPQRSDCQIQKLHRQLGSVIADMLCTLPNQPQEIIL